MLCCVCCVCCVCCSALHRVAVCSSELRCVACVACVVCVAVRCIVLYSELPVLRCATCAACVACVVCVACVAVRSIVLQSELPPSASHVEQHVCNVPRTASDPASPKQPQIPGSQVWMSEYILHSAVCYRIQILTQRK